MSIAVARNRASLSTSMSIEHFLYIGVLLVAVGLRFYGLASAPLSPLEAAGAWPAWLTANGRMMAETPLPDSALLHAVHLLLFWLAGGSDTLARFLPAVVGSALAWLPWLWRARLGRPMALVLAFLIAIDPWLVAFSRVATGAILSLALMLLVLTCLERMTWSRIRPETRWRWSIAGSIAAGLLLVSGAQSWSMWPILFAFAWFFIRPRMDGGGLAAFVAGAAASPDSTVEMAESGWAPPGHPGRTLFWYFAAAAVLGATAWLAQLQALGLVSASLTAWLGQIAGQADGGYPFSWLLLRLAADEPFALVFGVAGLILLWRRQRRERDSLKHHQALFLFLWLAWALILLLLPGRTPFDLPVLILPLLIGAAFALTSLARARPKEMDQHEAGLLLLVIGVLLVSIIFWLSALISDGGFDVLSASVGLLILLTAFLMALVYAIWAGWREALWILSSVAALLLLFATLRGTWQLNHDHDMTRQDGLFRQVTAPGTRILATDIATLSAQRTGDAGEIPLQVEMAVRPDPVLGWYLRDMRRLSWVLSAQSDVEVGVKPLVVALDTSTDPAGLQGDYVGSDYTVRTAWLPARLFAAPIPDPVVAEEATFRQRLDARLNGPWRARVQPLLRWLVYREAPAAPDTETILLWVERQ